MRFKEIVENQTAVDSPIFTAEYDKERDITKIQVYFVEPTENLQKGRKEIKFYFQYEEIEDFYYFIKEVKELTV